MVKDIQFTLEQCETEFMSIPFRWNKASKLITPVTVRCPKWYYDRMLLDKLFS